MFLVLHEGQFFWRHTLLVDHVSVVVHVDEFVAVFGEVLFFFALAHLFAFQEVFDLFRDLFQTLLIEAKVPFELVPVFPKVIALIDKTSVLTLDLDKDIIPVLLDLLVHLGERDESFGQQVSLFDLLYLDGLLVVLLESL